MIKILDISQTALWDKTVKEFEQADAYYLSGYVEGFRVHGDGEPILFLYETDDFKVLNVAMKRDISQDEDLSQVIDANRYYDLATPYGYGGFLMQGRVYEENITSFLKAYESFCNKENIISEFMRFNPVNNNAEELKPYIPITDLGPTITIDLTDLDMIWTNFKGNNRGSIRKAKKNNVEIFWGRDKKTLDDFIMIYNQTMDKDNAKSYYYFTEEYYQTILNNLKYNSMLFYATHDEKVISAAIILLFNGQLHYHLSGSDASYNSFSPSNLLLYEVAIWGHYNGYKTFHLGGGLGSQEDNLYRFKASFNKNSTTVFSIGKLIYNQEIYDELATLKSQFVSEIQTGFFPTYRAR